LLRIDDPFPAWAGLTDRLQRFRIVDVGSEALAFENHVYARLIERWPAVVLGFDPFAGEDAPDEVKPEGRNDVRWRTMKTFVGTGEPATFHVNRMQATSSLLPGNQTLASKFSLLGEALETVDRMPVLTRRLDDLLADDPDFKTGIDFLKIDVQGGSMQVLEGAKDCLARTLVCQVESEFSELYQHQDLFARIDQFMRKEGFALLDFANLGRQRYKSFDSSATYFFQAGRLLWADCVYVRSLDQLDQLGDEDLLKLAIIAHELYQKLDCATEALSIYDQRTGDALSDHFIESQDLGKPAEATTVSSSG
jgi:FkbM family methyltransferase